MLTTSCSALGALLTWTWTGTSVCKRYKTCCTHKVHNEIAGVLANMGNETRCSLKVNNGALVFSQLNQNATKTSRASPNESGARAPSEDAPLRGAGSRYPAATKPSLCKTSTTPTPSLRQQTKQKLQNKKKTSIFRALKFVKDITCRPGLTVIHNWSKSTKKKNPFCYQPYTLFLFPPGLSEVLRAFKGMIGRIKHLLGGTRDILIFVNLSPVWNQRNEPQDLKCEVYIYARFILCYLKIPLTYDDDFLRIRQRSGLSSSTHYSKDKKPKRSIPVF